MPRLYNRRTHKGGWSAGELRAALAAVENGTPLREVARTSGIPRSTLQTRRKTNLLRDPRFGRKSVFTQEEEQELALHVIKLSKLFYGISRSDIKKCAFQYAEKKNIDHPFNKNLQSSGDDWLWGFMKRNPNISLRKPEATSINRISAFNREAVSTFFSNLEAVQNRYNFRPTRIFNVDETGISTVQAPSKILAEKGQKQVGIATSWERGKNITIVCAFSASGTYVPPMFIFNRKRMNLQLQKGGPPGAMYSCSEKGWITEALFLDWLKHFREFTKPSLEDPVLLIMDNHATHCTLDVYRLCKSSGIVLLTIPPHTSHRLQPLDVTFYSALKTAYNVECTKYMKNHPFMKITPFEIAELFNNAFSRVSTPEKAIKGFNVTGIFPFNPDVFTTEDFAPAALQNESEAGDQQSETPEPIHENRTENRTPEPTYENRPENRTPIQADKDPTPEKFQVETSVFEQLLSLPGPSGLNKTTKQKTRRQRSEIVTATPNELLLEEKATRKKMRLESRRMVEERKLKKKLVETSMSMADKSPEKKKTRPPRSCKQVAPRKQVSSSSEDEDKESEKEVDEDICLVCGEFGKDREIWLQCLSCASWAHKACADYDKGQEFICDYCH